MKIDKHIGENASLQCVDQAAWQAIDACFDEACDEALFITGSLQVVRNAQAAIQADRVIARMQRGAAQLHKIG
jgi:hypothetical protein